MTERQTFRLVIPGKPVAWARPRTGRQGQFYNTIRTQEHRDLIGWLAKAALGDRPAPLFPSGPVQVNLVFDFGKEPKTVIEVRPIYPEKECHVTKPDLSNCIKLVEDSLTGIVFTDDAQVARLDVRKIKG